MVHLFGACATRGAPPNYRALRNLVTSLDPHPQLLSRDNVKLLPPSPLAPLPEGEGNVVPLRRSNLDREGSVVRVRMCHPFS